MSDEIVPSQPEEPSSRSLTVNELSMGAKKEQERLVALTQQVVKKLLSDISERGVVSLFHWKETGVLDKAICSVYLTSPKVPSLHVMLWGEFTSPSQSSLELEKRLFGVTHSGQKFIEANEHEPSKHHRAIAVVQSWEMQKDSYEIVYRRNAVEEAGNNPIPRSNREKMRYLQDILEAKVDVAATERIFGRPYVPGDSRSSGEMSDGRIPRTSWVRDLRNQIPGLPEAGRRGLLE